MTYTPDYTSQYNNGYRTYTTYGKNYSDTIMMLGRDYDFSDVVPEEHPEYDRVKSLIQFQEAMKGKEFTLQQAREYALKIAPDLMEWVPGEETPGRASVRPYSFDDIISPDHPAYESVVKHITWKEDMIGQFMTLEEAQSYAEQLVSSMSETEEPIYTDQPSPEEIQEYEQGGISLKKVLPYAAAGAIAFFLLR